MLKSTKEKVILILLILFIIFLPSYANAAKVSVGKVKGVSSSSQATNSVTIKWKAVSKATGYRVYVYNSSKKSYTYYGQTKSKTMTIKKLSSAQTYKIKVRAYRTVKGKKYYGSYSSVLTTSTTPTQVKNVKSTSRTDSSITLSWSKVTRATGYRVYVYNTSKKAYEYYGYSKTNSITVKKLNSATEYRFKIRAYRAVNKVNYWGAYSSEFKKATNVAQVKNLESTTNVGQVTGLSLDTRTEDSITVKWNKVNKASGYGVYVYSQYSKSFKLYKTTTSTTMKIENLDTAKFYKIYVVAYIEINGNKYYGDKSTTISQKTLSTDDIKAGIDVSKYQENINWKNVKNSEIDFAMIRIGFRGYGQKGTLVEDGYFKSNINGAIQQGIEVGVYFYSCALNEEEAEEEAKWVVDKLKENNIDNSKCKYIAYDFEEFKCEGHRTDGIDVEQVNKNAKVFLKYVADAGYIPILYGNTYDLTNRFETEEIVSEIENCKVWVAQYNDTTTYKGEYAMWQYSDAGLVSGIVGNVDLNIVNLKNL